MVDILYVPNPEQKIIVELAEPQHLTVDDFQSVVVTSNPASVSVVGSGPVGPPGFSDVPEPQDPADDGKGLVADGGEYILAGIVQSVDIASIVVVTQAEYDALPEPRDPTIMYVIRN